MSGVIPFKQQKNRMLKIGQLEPSEVETDPLQEDGYKIVQTDGHSV